MRRRGDERMAMALGLTLAATILLAGCSASTVADNLPGDLGLPAGAPARPAVTSTEYPAVHDMPPPRNTPTLTEEEQDRMERDLIRARDTQEGRQRDVKKKPPKPAKPAAATSGSATSGGRNP